MRLPLNESPADRVVRVVLGVILAGLALTGVVSGTLAIVVGVVAAIALVTGAVGFCPLYAIFRIGTKKSSI
jgi:hypothetical protein